MNNQNCLKKSVTILCVRCTQLPFQDLFWTSSYSGGASGVVTQGHSGSYYRGVRCFASFREAWEEDKCVFCALLKNTFQTFYTPDALEKLVLRGDEAGLYLFQEPLDLNLGRLTKKAEGDVSLSLIVIISRNYNEKYALSSRLSLPTADLAFSPQLIALRKDAIEHTAGDIVRGYDNDSELHLRAVDVIDGCVVDLPPRAQYMALSYVWGKDQQVKLRTYNLAQLSSKGYLQSPPGRPSKTIVDATHVVRSLGYRYLWVDSLCILQDDVASIQQNVMEMGRVYSRALFTIVAAAGVDANHGVPGVSPEVSRTQKQHRVAINGLHIPNRLHSDINSTWWNTRGWTYQERVLPSRLLFFSEVQVEYRCESTCSFQEQFHEAYSQAFSMFDNISYLDFKYTNLFAGYANVVTEYTKRSISNPMDKLKAFQGILGQLKVPFQAPFLFGLPVLLFDVGLLWHPIGSLNRSNQAFPSWSRAGWDGSVQWGTAGEEQLINLCESTVSICTIHYHYGNNSVPLCADTSPSANKHLSPTWERHFDEETDEIYYISEAQPHKGYRYSRPIASPSLLQYHKITDPISMILKIQGRVAILRLTGQHSAKNEANCSLGIHEKCNLAVLDAENRVAGTVTVDGKLIPQLQGRKHQFLGLSRST
ncbi:heterokaryon incompatibility protein-domain-containing protein [Xylariaceae sp. FL1651]|nr:heterokaryon incompatibility protein-domain-containing protein [Xylariaceae sp. FL1651]